MDADACPALIKEILFRAADRTQTQVTLVANHAMKVPASKFVSLMLVPGGFDVADDEIVRRIAAKDLVITGDIPLAAEVIAGGADAISSRGEVFTKDNITARLNMRDFMDTMRASGVMEGGGPPPMNQKDRKAFADELDRWLARQRS